MTGLILELVYMSVSGMIYSFWITVIVRTSKRLVYFNSIPGQTPKMPELVLDLGSHLKKT